MKNNFYLKRVEINGSEIYYLSKTKRNSIKGFLANNVETASIMAQNYIKENKWAIFSMELTTLLFAEVAEQKLRQTMIFVLIFALIIFLVVITNIQ